jgi:hypothetical protein
MSTVEIKTGLQWAHELNMKPKELFLLIEKHQLEPVSYKDVHGKKHPQYTSEQIESILEEI